MASVLGEPNNFLVLTLAPSAVCQAEKASQALKNDSPSQCLWAQRRSIIPQLPLMPIPSGWWPGSQPFFLERILVACWSTGPGSWPQADWSAVTPGPKWPHLSLCLGLRHRDTQAESVHGSGLERSLGFLALRSDTAEALTLLKPGGRQGPGFSYPADALSWLSPRCPLFGSMGWKVFPGTILQVPSSPHSWGN